jgi:hypothetical protein
VDPGGGPGGWTRGVQANRFVWMAIENQTAPQVENADAVKTPEQFDPKNIEAALKEAQNLPKTPDKEPGNPEKLVKTEKDLMKAYENSESPEQKQKLAELIKNFEQNKSTASLIDLHTLTTSEEGRETMRQSYASGEVKEGQTIDVNFQSNNSAEWNIGAGDLLPTNVREITVTTKDGKTMRGKRAPSPENPNPKRVGYYAEGKYVPIFSGDKIIIEDIASEDEMKDLNEKVKAAAGGKDLGELENSLHETKLQQTKEEQRSLQEFLKKQDIKGLEDIENLDAQKIKTAFQAMGGREVWLTRKSLGPKKLQQIFKDSGLVNEKISINNILKDNPEIKAVVDKLPPEMARKIMKIESANHPFAVSDTGALGCMQLTKWIYHDINPPINPFDPVQAVKRAAEHLLDVYQKTGSEEKTVRTYNGGPNYANNAGADRHYYEKYLKA